MSQDQWPEYIRCRRIAIIKIIEAVTWVRIYFVAASVDHDHFYR